jgi:hypothetical protein
MHVRYTIARVYTEYIFHHSLKVVIVRTKRRPDTTGDSDEFRDVIELYTTTTTTVNSEEEKVYYTVVCCSCTV